MKVLHIIDSGGLYGAETMLLSLVAQQCNLGMEAVIASIGGTGIAEKPLERVAQERGFKVQKFRMRNGPNLLGACRILDFARSEGFDILHSHGYKGNILLGFLPKVVRKIPLVATLHGWTSAGYDGKLKLYEWLDAKSLKFLDGVALVSETMKSDRRLRGLNQTNLYVVNNGISPSELTTQDFAQVSTASMDSLDATIIQFCSQAYTIGSIGRLSREKGYKNLIGAVKILSEYDSEIRLIIIGEGPERQNLEKEIDRMDLNNKVMLPGYRNEAKSYLPYFKVFVTSSLTEGLPMSILEAMQAGVPVISTRVGAVPKLLKNGAAGILVDLGSDQVLADAIQYLRDSPKLKDRMAEEARKEVKQTYSSERMAMSYLEIYSMLLHSQQERQ